MPMKIVSSQNTKFEPIEEGVYEVDISRIYEKKQFNRFENKEEEGINFEFTIVDEGPMKGRKAFRFIRPYLTPKSTLWALWRAMKGDNPSAEELAQVSEISDLIDLLGGKPIQIVVKNVTAKTTGNKYYVIDSYLKSKRPKGQTPFVAGAPAGEEGHVTTTYPGVPMAPEPEQATSMKSVADEMAAEESAGIAKAEGKPA